MRGTLLAVAVLASSLAAVTPARAQSAQVAQVSSVPSPPATGAEAAADRLVEQAARAYDQNRLDEALGLLARAYALSERPSILYNQAQVWRAKDDCTAALDAYGRFIDATTPDDPNRARASRWRDEMQACVDRRKAEAAAPSPAATPPASPAAVTSAPPPPAPLTVAPHPPAEDAPALTLTSPVASSPPDESQAHRRHTMRVAGWSLLGAGVVTAGVAAAFAWQAHQHQNELNQKIDSHSPWTDGPRSLADEGQRDASWARWLGAAAAAAGAGGVALLIVSSPPAAVGVTSGTPPRATTALLGWSGTF